MSSYPSGYRLPYSPTDHYLDLVRGLFIWSISKGNPNILIDIVHSYFMFKHDELKHKIVFGPNLGGVDLVLI